MPPRTGLISLGMGVRSVKRRETVVKALGSAVKACVWIHRDMRAHECASLDEHT